MNIYIKFKILCQNMASKHIFVDMGMLLVMLLIIGKKLRFSDPEQVEKLEEKMMENKLTKKMFMDF